MRKYPTMKDAMKSFDDSGNNKLSMAEFCTGAKKLRFGGDLKAVFKELDTNADGFISSSEFRIVRTLARSDGFVTEGMLEKTKVDHVEEKRLRQGLRGPAPHARGECLASSHITFPHGERISSSAGFHSFRRSTTGRLDLLMHPSECPGDDAEQYSKEHGPGYLKKGPEYFSESGDVDHPTRGNGWKLGANMNRDKKFTPTIPSNEAREDRECHGGSFCTYEGDAPKDTWTVNNLGAHSLALKKGRLGKTYGTASSHGLMGPKPTGPWAETRMGVNSLRRSAPTLLRLQC
jgi:hypothetical protein